MKDVGFSSPVNAAQVKVQEEIRDQISRAAGSSNGPVRRSVSGAQVAEVAGEIAGPVFREAVRSMNIPPELAAKLREEMMVFIKNHCAEISQASQRRQTEQRTREEEDHKTRKPSEEREETFHPGAFKPSEMSESPRLKAQAGERGDRSVPALKSKKSLSTFR